MTPHPDTITAAIAHQLTQAGVTSLEGVRIARRRVGERTEYRVSVDGGPQGVLVLVVTEGGFELPGMRKEYFKPELGRVRE